ncbi:MAG TPA: hypothetical protein DDZ67_06270 [Xanthomonadaceae bacterium]|nr:hypothetical protein [Xanthomonadaceae bacterium]
MRLDTSPRRGLLGLRLQPLARAPILAPATPDRPGYGPWRALRRERGLYWTQAGDARLAVLLDVGQAKAWLLWEDGEQRTWSWH